LAHRCDTGLQGPKWLRETGAERSPSGHASQCNGPMAVASGLGGEAGLSGPFPRYEGQSGESDDGGHQAGWPSRPGEQQYAWEPPRVVGNSEDRSNRQHSTEQQGRSAFSGPSGEDSVGDTEGGTRLGSAQRETGHSAQSDQNMADASISGSDRRPDGTSGRSREPGETGEDVAGCGGESNGMRQTQPPLGGDADGPPGGLDYAQLCVSGDNRTDELRLLGNGVVPATAERAFRSLIAELQPL
jgi:hypothetical protein